MPENTDRQIELRADRESISSYIVGFLRASQQAALPHQSLSGSAFSSELMSCALSHLQVFSVRALETLFRDCFILLCKRDPSFLQRATESTKGKIDYVTLASFLNGKSTIEEHLAAQRNFQNLDTINLAFEPLFGRPTFEELKESNFSVFLPGSPPQHISFSLKEKDPTPLLYELFTSRHQIIHNSNRPLPSDQAAVLEQANAALLVGQLFGTYLAQKLGIGTIAIEAPLWMVVFLASRIDKASDADPSKAAEGFASNPELAGKTGHIGPSLILGKDLMRLRFIDHHSTSKAISEGRPVIHLITTVGEFLELQTLQGIQEPST